MAAFEGDGTGRLDCRGFRGLNAAFDAALDATLGAAGRLGSHLGPLFLQNRFARQADAIAFDRQHLDQHLIAFLQFVADILDAVLGNFGDVQQAVGAGENLHESAEVGQTRDLSEISLAHLGRRRNLADHLQRPGSGCAIARRNQHLAGVVDVDLDAGGLDNSADDLPARTDEVADLVGRDLQGIEARRVLGNLGARFAEHRVHLVEDEQTSALGLLQGLAHDLGRDSLDLDIHLQRGNANSGAGNLEVHVAIVVFGAGDVGENGVLIAFLHQPHGDPGDGSAQRNAGVHHAERAAADGRHRGRTVRLENIGDHADGVRKILFGRQHGQQRALGQRSVADLAAAGAAQERDLSHRKRREVVVQHEALLGFAFEAFEPLHVFAGAQRRRHQGLGLAARKDRRSVSPRQYAGLNPDLANLVEGAPVRTAFFVRNLFAEDAFAQNFEVFGKLAPFGAGLFRNGRQQFRKQSIDLLIALDFRVLLGIEGVRQTLADLGAQSRQIRRIDYGRRNRPLRLARARGQLGDDGADLLDLAVPEFDGVHHAIFLDFAGPSLDHDDRLGGADHHQIQLAFVDFAVSRIDNELIVQQADAHGSDRSMEGNVGNRQRAGCAIDGGNIGIVVGIGRQYQGDHLGIITKSFGKERANGTVDLAADQDFTFTGAAFALDKTSGNSAPGIGIFAVIDGQREKVSPARPRLRVGAGGGEHHILADAHHDGAVCLLGQFSGFKTDGLAVDEVDGGFLLHFIPSIQEASEPLDRAAHRQKQKESASWQTER